MTILNIILICIIIYLLYKVNEPFDDIISANIQSSNNIQTSDKEYSKYTFKYNNEDYIFILYSQLDFKLQTKICDMILKKEIILDILDSEIKDIKVASELEIPIVPRNDIVFVIKSQNFMNFKLNRSESILIFDKLQNPNIYNINTSYMSQLTYDLVKSNDTLLLNSSLSKIYIDLNNNKISNKFIKINQISDLELYQITLTDIDNNIKIMQTNITI